MTESKIKRYELQLRRQQAEEREAIISESPPALAEKFTRARGILDEEWRRTIVGRYQLR